MATSSRELREMEYQNLCDWFVGINVIEFQTILFVCHFKITAQHQTGATIMPQADVPLPVATTKAPL